MAAVAASYPDFEVIINLQGDEPFIKPEMLTALVQPFFSNNAPEMSTLACPLEPEEYANPDNVKVITDKNGDAIYFSRAPIPHFRAQMHTNLASIPVYHHQGVYAFRRNFLATYTTLSQTPLEIAESLEQLRALEHGYKIRVCVTPHRILEINTPDELLRAQVFEG